MSHEVLCFEKSYYHLINEFLGRHQNGRVSESGGLVDDKTRQPVDSRESDFGGGDRLEPEDQAVSPRLTEGADTWDGESSQDEPIRSNPSETGTAESAEQNEESRVDEDDTWISGDTREFPDDIAEPYTVGARIGLAFANDELNRWIGDLRRRRLLVLHADESTVLYAAAEGIAKDICWDGGERRVFYVKSRNNDLDVHEAARRSVSRDGTPRLLVVFDGHSDDSLLLSNNYAPERVKTLLRKLSRWNLYVLIVTREYTLSLARDKYDIQTLLEYSPGPPLNYIEPRLRFHAPAGIHELLERVEYCLELWGDSPKAIGEALDKSFRNGTFREDLDARERGMKDPSKQQQFRSGASKIAITELVERVRRIDPYLGTTTLWTAALLPDLPVEDFENAILSTVKAWGEGAEWSKLQLQSWRTGWVKLIDECRLRIDILPGGGPGVRFPDDTDASRIFEVLRLQYRFDHLRMIDSMERSGLLLQGSPTLSARVAGAMGHLAFIEPESFGRDIILRLLNSIAGESMGTMHVDSNVKNLRPHLRRRMLEAVGRVVRSVIKKGGHEQSAAWLLDLCRLGGSQTAVQIFFLSAPENFTVAAQVRFLSWVINRGGQKEQDACMGHLLRLLSGENAREALEFLRPKMDARQYGIVVCNIVERSLRMGPEDSWTSLPAWVSPDGDENSPTAFWSAVADAGVRGRAVELASRWFKPSSGSCLWTGLFFPAKFRQSLGMAATRCIQAFERGVEPVPDFSLHPGDRLGALLFISLLLNGSSNRALPTTLADQIISAGFQSDALAGGVQELRHVLLQTSIVTSRETSIGGPTLAGTLLQSHWAAVLSRIDEAETALACHIKVAEENGNERAQ